MSGYPALAAELEAAGLNPMLAEAIGPWQDDPVLFCNEVFEQKLREQQGEYLLAVRDHKRVALKACRDWGKTAFAGYAALWWLCTHPSSLVITTAGTWEQIAQAVWVEIRKLWMDSLLPKIFPSWEVQQTAIKTSRPEWRGFGISSDRPANLEGPRARAILVVYDEAKIVANETRETMQGLFTDEVEPGVPRQWRELAISNPGGKFGWFYDAFTTKKHLWYTLSVSADQVPRLRSTYDRELAERGQDDPWFKRFWKAEFAGDEGGEFFPEAAISQCVDLPLPRQATWRKVLGIDPAGTGQDEFCLTYRYGPVILKQETWSGRDEMKSVGTVVKRVTTFDPWRIIVDRPGLGSPIISRLREVMGDDERIVSYNPGGEPINEREHENFKTSVAFMVRDRFMHKAISIPNDSYLISQLSAMTTKTSSRGRDQIVEPKSQKTDRANSLLIAFAADLERVSAVAA